jgi:hypothetical protein
MSTTEIAAISSLPHSPVEPGSPVSEDRPGKLLIDTDIGTDVDDSLALLDALRLPDVEVIGVTTITSSPPSAPQSRRRPSSFLPILSRG